MKKPDQTMRVYRMEEMLFQGTPHYADMPMHELRSVARSIWAAEKPRRRFPRIVAGAGLKDPGDMRRYSYFVPYTLPDIYPPRIELARDQRNMYCLLHELTHAMGYGDHGAAFVRRYFKLLQCYGGIPRALLVDAAAHYGVQL